MLCCYNLLKQYHVRKQVFTMEWNGKPYHSLDYELRQQFGRKIYKLSLDGGMSCPNRDGTLGTGGCIFCSQGGSGDLPLPDRRLSPGSSSRPWLR